MKSLYPYLVMFILFIASNRLVNRQQQYIRSIQASAQGEPTTFMNATATSESNIQPLEQKPPKLVPIPTAGRSWKANQQPLKNYTTNEKPSVFRGNMPVSH